MKTLSQELAEASWADGICRSFAPHAWEDLRQELFLYCTVEHAAAAEKARAAGCLEYFYIRCAANYTRPKGRLNTHWQRGGEELPATIYTAPDCEPEPDDEEQRLQAIGSAYAGLDWYERGLIDLYCGGWSIREISRRTRITDKEIRRVVAAFRQAAINAKTPPKQGRCDDNAAKLRDTE